MHIKTNLIRVVFLLGMLFSLSPLASPGLALALGLILALSFDNPFIAIGHRISKPLLQCSVVFLGFGMDLLILLRTGAQGLLFAAATIFSTFLLGLILARILRINRTTSALISAGTAICGGSAIAAVGAVMGAGDAAMSVAMGTVFILNAIALYVFPFLGHLMGLSATQFGVWSGVAIHDVSSVVGAASQFGDVALQTATAVKLSRALWIVPLVVLISWMPNLRDENEPLITGTHAKRKTSLHIPWFIGFFLLASLARSFVPGIPEMAPSLTYIARLGLTLTLFLIGASLSRKSLQAVGIRPLLQGLLLWLFIATSSLIVVLRIL